MVVELNREVLVAQRERALAEYQRVKKELSRTNVVDAKGNRLESPAYHKWRVPLVRRYNELASELVEVNALLRELRQE